MQSPLPGHVFIVNEWDGMKLLQRLASEEIARVDSVSENVRGMQPASRLVIHSVTNDVRCCRIS